MPYCRVAEYGSERPADFATRVLVFFRPAHPRAPPAPALPSKRSTPFSKPAPFYQPPPSPPLALARRARTHACPCPRARAPPCHDGAREAGTCRPARGCASPERGRARPPTAPPIAPAPPPRPSRHRPAPLAPPTPSQRPHPPPASAAGAGRRSAPSRRVRRERGARLRRLRRQRLAFAPVAAAVGTAEPRLKPQSETWLRAAPPSLCPSFPSATVSGSGVSRAGPSSLSCHLRVGRKGKVGWLPALSSGFLVTSEIPEGVWRWREEADAALPPRKTKGTFSTPNPSRDTISVTPQRPPWGADPRLQGGLEGSWHTAISTEVIPFIYLKERMLFHVTGPISHKRQNMLSGMEDRQVASASGNINTQGQASGWCKGVALHRLHVLSYTSCWPGLACRQS